MTYDDYTLDEVLDSAEFKDEVNSLQNPKGYVTNKTIIKFEDSKDFSLHFPLVRELAIDVPAKDGSGYYTYIVSDDTYIFTKGEI